MNALALVSPPEAAPRLRVKKNPYATASRLTLEHRVRAMVRCRLFSRETWQHAVDQFLSDPATAAFAQAELRTMRINL